MNEVLKFKAFKGQSQNPENDNHFEQAERRIAHAIIGKIDFIKTWERESWSWMRKGMFCVKTVAAEAHHW